MMFHLQPGNGLGFTGSKQMAFGLGGFGAIVDVITTGGVWIAHASGHVWNARPVATAWQAVCSTFNWKADDC
jgi:hypothetical protein